MRPASRIAETVCGFAVRETPRAGRRTRPASRPGGNRTPSLTGFRLDPTCGAMQRGFRVRPNCSTYIRSTKQCAVTWAAPRIALKTSGRRPTPPGRAPAGFRDGGYEVIVPEKDQIWPAQRFGNGRNEAQFCERARCRSYCGRGAPLTLPTLPSSPESDRQAISHALRLVINCSFGNWLLRNTLLLRFLYRTLR